MCGVHCLQTLHLYTHACAPKLHNIHGTKRAFCLIKLFFPAVAVVTGPYQSAATVTGAECKYQNVFGVDVDKIIGGGASTFTLKKTVQVRTHVNS